LLRKTQAHIAELETEVESDNSTDSMEA
jgi:hypothetical protein